jgi:cytochrome P450
MTRPDIHSFGESITVELLDADPYPIYARMREEFPVCWVPAVGLWFVTRWDDVQYVTTHPELFTADVAQSPLRRALGENVLTVDGDLHKRLRGPMEAGLRTKLVDAWAPGIVGAVAEPLLQELAPRGGADIMEAFLEPVSVLSLGRVLGLGDLDADTLRHWFFSLATGGANHEQDPDKYAVSDAASAAIDVRMAPILDRLQEEPGDTLLGAMLRDAAGELRPRTEVLSDLKLILLGGMQEPGHGAGLTLWALLTHPEQRRRVAEAPELLTDAVEEGMRWMAPVGTSTRQLVRPATIAGVTLEAGSRIAAVLSSANRDERRWRDADAFDVCRPRLAHRAFGTGPTRLPVLWDPR